MEVIDVKYVLDTNVFIGAKSYYAREICPTFQDCLLELHARRKLLSIDYVYRELVRKRDDPLARWVAGPGRVLFAPSNSPEVKAAHDLLKQQVKAIQQYDDDAKDKFLKTADSWLIAYSLAEGTKLVTHEEPAPNSKSRVLIPDICRIVGVEYLTTFDMLKELEVQFPDHTFPGRRLLKTAELRYWQT